MTLKSGVRILGIRPEVVLAAGIARDLFKERGAVFVMTSVIDGTHKRASVHYNGGAFDLRRPDWPDYNRPIEAGQITEELKRRLGDDFDVILEKDHIHVEFQPKAPY